MKNGFPSIQLLRFGVLPAGIVTLLLCTSCQAGTLRLPSTGVSDKGSVLGLHSAEQHYVVSGPVTLAYAVQPYSGMWLRAPSGSAWIGPNRSVDGGAQAPLGLYHYILNFDIEGMDPSRLVLAGSWTADDGGEIFLNGVSTGVTIGGPWSFARLHHFTIDSGFVPGTNVLDFRILNGEPASWGNPSGLLVSSLMLTDGTPSDAPDLANGSFELGIDPYPGPGHSLPLDAVDSKSIKGWVLSSGSIDYIDGRWQAGDGDRCIDLSGLSAGTLMQEVKGFIKGRSYRLSFLMAGNPEAGPTVKSLVATIGSSSQTFTFDGTGFTASDMGWTLHIMDFVATNTAMPLTFTSLQNGWSGPSIDDVRITPVGQRPWRPDRHRPDPRRREWRIEMEDVDKAGPPHGAYHVSAQSKSL